MKKARYCACGREVKAKDVSVCYSCFSKGEVAQSAEEKLNSLVTEIDGLPAYEENDRLHEHTITSRNVLCCAETGRVIAVFYNDYDIEKVLSVKALIDKYKGGE